MSESQMTQACLGTQLLDGCSGISLAADLSVAKVLGNARDLGQSVVWPLISTQPSNVYYKRPATIIGPPHLITTMV